MDTIYSINNGKESKGLNVLRIGIVTDIADAMNLTVTITEDNVHVFDIAGILERGVFSIAQYREMNKAETMAIAVRMFEIANGVNVITATDGYIDSYEADSIWIKNDGVNAMYYTVDSRDNNVEVFYKEEGRIYSSKDYEVSVPVIESCRTSHGYIMDELECIEDEEVLEDMNYGLMTTADIMMIMDRLPEGGALIRDGALWYVAPVVHTLDVPWNVAFINADGYIDSYEVEVSYIKQESVCSSACTEKLISALRAHIRDRIVWAYNEVRGCSVADKLRSVSDNTVNFRRVLRGVA